MGTTWYFVLPEDRTQPSGGNIYNQRLIDALNQTNQPTEIITAGTYVNAIQQDQVGVYWVDTLILEQIRGLLSFHPQRACSLLIVHHLPSLAPSTGQSREALSAEEKPFLEWFQGFLATSEFTRTYLQQQGFSQPVLVVEPGFSISKIAALPRSTSSIRALMVANVVERKGILPWLQQLATALLPADTFSLMIVGRTDLETDYAERCLLFIQEHPLLNRRVQLAGSQSPDRMGLLYLQANLLISTAIMETYGMALQEARAYRLPILALDGGNSSQHIIPNQTGCVFDNLGALRDFFFDLVRDTSKFATLYQRTQQHSPTFHSWEDAVQSLFQQFYRFFTHVS